MTISAPYVRLLTAVTPPELLISLGLLASTAAAATEATQLPTVAINTQPTDLPAHLQTVQQTGQVTLHVREGNLLQLPRAAAKVLVADPRIASFQVPSPTSVFVFAQSVGTTTLYALDAQDQVIAAIRVIAEHNLSELREQIKRSVPGVNIELEPALNNRMIVRGSVRTPMEARQVVEQVQAYLDAARSSSGAAGGGGAGGSAGASTSSVINQLKVQLSSQINIQVRVVEVSRSLSHELGFDWGAALNSGSGSLAFGTGNATALFDASSASALLPATSTGGAILGGITTRGRFSLGGLISALSSEGMATLLAEPNLTAMSGESAAFAAGGEVPIVIITNNNVQIDYKSYGVILRMTPTLLSPNRISLHIAPEVSELTDEGSVTLSGGSTIPALKVRRADTTVELASGQSFALAGMLRSTTSQTISGVPGLSSIPWMGRLFEHEASAKEDTELVILVTANVVDPVAAGELQVPGRGLPAIDEHLPQQAAIGYLY
ncbi:type II and III secretion system protein family protein [Corticibacter populi]|uniref:Type II and III secretion system protein family protein n=1 Tax=Corticibacter populi TaxID=1550736 RepID=A0A3M6QUZ8_9BURK|nr:type II and III secretion system protein family protein [Corticibacter populi]RMX06847.1 type II and III secretion system protein family protein [Corticibacter populi]RZS31562.1 pilus assembly protein CpaC [Corticibacter populi]